MARRRPRRPIAVRDNPVHPKPMSDGMRMSLLLLGVIVVAGIAIAANSGTAAASP